MKIGLVLDDSLDPPDGVQQYVLTLGHWLTQQGHTVHYLVGETKRTDLPYIKSLSRNVAVAFNGNRMRIPLPANKAGIRRLLLAEQYDVLHIQMPYSPMLAQRIIMQAPDTTAIIGTFHIVAYSKLVTIANRMLALTLKPSLKRFDTVFAVSEPAAALAASAYDLETVVVPNMVDVQRFKVDRKRVDNLLRVAYLGRLVERKGCQTLLEALFILQKRSDLPAFETVIGGKGPLLDALQQYSQHEQLSAVRFVGFVDEADKPAFLADADICVFPSKGGESFGIILVEAMASGHSAVLGGDNSGYRTVLSTQPEALFKADDAAGLADTLERLLKDPAERSRLAAAQSAAAAIYDQQVLGPRLVATYQSQLRRRRATGIL